jgi:hypothetical protein
MLRSQQFHLTNDLMVHQRVRVFLPGEAGHAALRDRLATDKLSHEHPHLKRHRNGRLSRPGRKLICSSRENTDSQSNSLLAVVV